METWEWILVGLSVAVMPLVLRDCWRDYKSTPYWEADDDRV